MVLLNEDIEWPALEFPETKWLWLPKFNSQVLQPCLALRSFQVTQLRTTFLDSELSIYLELIHLWVHCPFFYTLGWDCFPNNWLFLAFGNGTQLSCISSTRMCACKHYVKKNKLATILHFTALTAICIKKRKPTSVCYTRTSFILLSGLTPALILYFHQHRLKTLNSKTSGVGIQLCLISAFRLQ